MADEAVSPNEENIENLIQNAVREEIGNISAALTQDSNDVEKTEARAAMLDILSEAESD
jgi:hypothetical protein